MSTHDKRYVSPLMENKQGQETLTLKVLAREVPIVHEGNAAQKRLNEETLDRTERRTLSRTATRGERAKEHLILVAMPLIRSLAHKEFRRRQSWQSRVTLEDIVSEGIGGFLRGINAYNPEGKHKSPTNYLGQWIITDMRRNVEQLEHDFSVPYEAMERQRKIRAIRSRLSSEYGREPTDEEIIEAANIPGGYGDNMLGRADKKSRTTNETTRRRLISQKHLDEERNMARRTGAVTPMEATAADSGGTYSTVDVHTASSVTDEDGQQYASVESVEKEEMRKALQDIIEDSFSLIGVGTAQRDVIRRKYGLNPYVEEQTLKTIALETSIPKHKVTKIVNLFAREMTTPHGFFHELIDQMDEDHTDALSMGWLISSLGKFDPKAPRKHPHQDLISEYEVETTMAVFYCPNDDIKVQRPPARDEGSIEHTIRCPKCRRVIVREN